MNLVFLLGIFFVISFQPLLMVSSLILITLIYSYLIYMNLGTFWFSYILMMVMLSGVMVLFTYMISLIPNESFESYGMIMFISMFIFMIFKYSFFYSSDMSVITSNLWISFLGIFNLMMISFLLVIMLLVVYLSYMEEGAFRV